MQGLVPRPWQCAGNPSTGKPQEPTSKWFRIEFRQSVLWKWVWLYIVEPLAFFFVLTKSHNIPPFVAPLVVHRRTRVSGLMWWTWPSAPVRPASRLGTEFFIMVIGGWLSIHDPWWSMMIHDDPWWSMMIHDDPWWSMMIHDDPWWSMMIHDDSWICGFTYLSCSDMAWGWTKHDRHSYHRLTMARYGTCFRTRDRDQSIWGSHSHSGFPGRKRHHETSLAGAELVNGNYVLGCLPSNFGVFPAELEIAEWLMRLMVGWCLYQGSTEGVSEAPFAPSPIWLAQRELGCLEAPQTVGVGVKVLLPEWKSYLNIPEASVISDQW